MKHHIPVVAISDNKLTFTVGTLFVNLLDTKHKDTFYDFFAVMAPDVSRENINKIKQIEKTYKNDCSITIIKMDNRFDNISNNTGYIANACAYKMCLAEMLPKLDKVIYLDTDIIVFDDLSEFYNTDMKDAYIGGVHSISHYLYRRELIEKLKIPDLAYYINAGVMLMNLKQIRQDRIQTKLTELIGTYNDSVDQHIFNRVCYGHIKLLSPVYNVTRTVDLVCSETHQLIGVTPYEYKLIQERPVIYHYTGREKPWKYFDLKYALIWLRYYKKSPFGNDVLLLESYNGKNQDFSTTIVNKKVQWYKKIFSIDKKINDAGKKICLIRFFGLQWSLSTHTNHTNNLASCDIYYYKRYKSQGTRFPHLCGIVISRATTIGKNCIIYQNVTIGSKNIETGDRNPEHYPVIGNNVIIYAGAVIIGHIHIGDNAIIGANSVVMHDVPPNSIVVGCPAKIIKPVK